MIRRWPSYASFSFFFPNRLLHLPAIIVVAPNMVVTSRCRHRHQDCNLYHHHQRPGPPQCSIQKDDDDNDDDDDDDDDVCSIPSTRISQVRWVPSHSTATGTRKSTTTNNTATTSCRSLELFVVWSSCRTAGQSQRRSTSARTFSSTTTTTATTSFGPGHHHHNNHDDIDNDDDETLQQEIQDAHDRQDKVQVLSTSTSATTLCSTGYGVFAKQSFQIGDLVLQARALQTLPVQGTHTIQVDWNSHVYMDLPSRLLNHKCGKQRTKKGDNNTGGGTTGGGGGGDGGGGANLGIQKGGRPNSFGAYDFVALVPIESGDQVTFDYECTEYELVDNGFECSCGSFHCRGRIQGFRHSRDLILADFGPEQVASYLLQQPQQQQQEQVLLQPTPTPTPPL
jgi:uncharacterized protein